MCITPTHMGSLYAYSPRRSTSKGLLTFFLAVLSVAFPARHILAENPIPGSKKDTVTKSGDPQTQKPEKEPWSGLPKPLNGLNYDKAPQNLLLRMVIYCLLIVVLAVLAVVVLKKLVPRIQRSSGKNLLILETTYVAPRSSLHLLRVGTKKYLLSRSGDGLSLLAEVTQALDDEDTTPGSAE